MCDRTLALVTLASTDDEAICWADRWERLASNPDPRSKSPSLPRGSMSMWVVRRTESPLAGLGGLAASASGLGILSVIARRDYDMSRGERAHEVALMRGCRDSRLEVRV